MTKARGYFSFTSPKDSTDRSPMAASLHVSGLQVETRVITDRVNHEVRKFTLAKDKP